MLNKLLRGEDVAEILNVSKPMAYKLMKIGLIPTIKLGRSVRVRVEDLEAYIAASLSGGTIPHVLQLPAGKKRL